MNNLNNNISNFISKHITKRKESLLKSDLLSFDNKINSKFAFKL